jgi:CO/xanthine dehydrogenase FAD-binding subunit
MVGSVSWKPLIPDLQQLIGQRLNAKMLREAVQGVGAAAEPMPDVRGSVIYKREMAVEFAARMLIAAWERAAKK